MYKTHANGIDIGAVYHQGYDNFCYPLNDDELVINLQTGKDVEKVELFWADPFKNRFDDKERKWEPECAEMTEKTELQANFFWSHTVKPDAKRCRYFFKLYGKNEAVYYLDTGFYAESEFDLQKHCLKAFTFPWMNPIDTARVPEWAKSAIFYQIFPARFCRGKSDFEPKFLKAWGKFGEKVNHFDVYGGNLQGITDKLDYLHDLGITGIYMTPINASDSQHKYDTTDYLKIDESFGDEKTLKTLVSEAHKRNIRIMLDGVFNHCGYNFFAWQDVLKNREKSKYASWFMINDFNFELSDDWRKMHNSLDKKYYSFAFTDFMPKWNTNNPEVRKYLIDIAKKWVADYDIDGLRFDVANEISHVFVQEMRRSLLAMKSDFFFLGEIWHNSQNWLRGNEYDSVMNYPLENAILDLFLDENANGDGETARDFEFNVNKCRTMYYKQITSVLFNQMDSHDTMRMMTKFGSDKKKAESALCLLFSLPGTVCLYYGTEILLEGGNDPDCRRCMPWAEIENGQFNDELDWMKKIIALRKNHQALRSNNVEFLQFNGNDKVVDFVKTADDGSEKFEIIVNVSSETVKVEKVAEKVVLTNGNFSGENAELMSNCFVMLER